jgi:hypothetical protein
MTQHVLTWLSVLSLAGCLVGTADDSDHQANSSFPANPAFAQQTVGGDIVTTGQVGFAISVDVNASAGHGTAPPQLENIDVAGISFTTPDPFPGVSIDIDLATADHDCALVEYGGMTGWRLPSRGELRAAAQLDLGTVPGYAATTGPAYTKISTAEVTIAADAAQGAVDQCYRLRGVAQQLCLSATLDDDAGASVDAGYDLQTAALSAYSSGARWPTVCVHDAGGP